jgi:predicted O-linked N-acetylglucosamine transferase (SPINDLY family)
MSINTPDAIEHCEAWVSQEPENVESWAYLGLSYLLNGDEESAQLTWLNSLTEVADNTECPTEQKLIEILESEAHLQFSQGTIQNSWLIRQYIRELKPDSILNLFNLIHESTLLEQFDPQDLEEWNIVEHIQNFTGEIDNSFLAKICSDVLQIPSQPSLDFTEACLQQFSSIEQWSQVLTDVAQRAVYEKRLGHYGTTIIELCLKHNPTYRRALGYLPRFYMECERYQDAIDAARKLFEYWTSPSDSFFANCTLLQALIKAGAWNEIPAVAEHHKMLIKQLAESQSTQLSKEIIQYLIVNAGFFAYLQDNLVENRWFQNQAAQLLIRNIQANASGAVKPVKLSNNPKPRIRVGYIASTLRNHSVGWLSRWLFKYHNRETFEIHIYLVQQRRDNAFLNQWFVPQVDSCTFLENDIGKAADTIRDAQLDILIDLDSFTLDFTAMVMALKPAPIQATWLGCDASGLSTIDYFIADPYVLPDNAQEFYQEKIWRLPQTYIAVEGFEIDIPTLRRSDLDIPDDAIVYLSAQTGVKRNPDTLRLQLQILKAVPNSYLLIKGLADQTTIQQVVTNLAQTEGVSPDRLRFLPMVSNEYQHRANLGIADVVLDTYPYNGATTTLETLWVGIPLVTRVGSTFSARNSYAFLKNVGIEEGISRTNAEYVEWGIRFGMEEQLRQHITWKMKQSRKTSPLWNIQKFVHDMESAYQQMIEVHKQNHND